MRDSLITNAEQRRTQLFCRLFTSMELPDAGFAVWRFRRELLETRLRIRSASGQVNLLTGESVTFSALHTSIVDTMEPQGSEAGERVRADGPAEFLQVRRSAHARKFPVGNFDA